MDLSSLLIKNVYMKKVFLTLSLFGLLLCATRSHAAWEFCHQTTQVSIDAWKIHIYELQSEPGSIHQPYVRYTINTPSGATTTAWEPLAGSAFTTTGVGTGLGSTVSNIEIQFFDITTMMPVLKRFDFHIC